MPVGDAQIIDINIDDLSNVVLRAASTLTEQQNYLSLSHCFVDLVKQISNVEAVFVYEVHQDDRNSEEKDTFTFRRLTGKPCDLDEIPATPGMISSCRTRTMVNEECDPTGCNRTIFPIIPQSGFIRLVVIEAKKQICDVLCQGLITLYKNQLILMDRMERDRLTGLLNRQTFDERIIPMSENVLKLSHDDGRNGDSVWLGVLDIDHFKRINDTYGHLYGDEILIHFAKVMEKCFRHCDLLFRFGGEEFVVLLVSDGVGDGAKIAFDRFRSIIEQYSFPFDNQVTVSIGFAKFERKLDISSLIDRADKALYYSKDHGRNQVNAYEDLLASSEIETSSLNDDIEIF